MSHSSDSFENDFEDEENCFEVVEKQFEERKHTVRRTGLIASRYKFPQKVINRAFAIYTELMQEKYFERINKISNVAFVCFYFASIDVGYHRTPKEIARRVDVKESSNLMTILRDYSHLYTSYRRVPTRVTCLDIVSEYRESFPVIDKDYDKVAKIWEEMIHKERGMTMNKNPVMLAGCLITLYMSNMGLDVNEVPTVLGLKSKDMKRYMKMFDEVYNS